MCLSTRFFFGFSSSNKSYFSFCSHVFFWKIAHGYAKLTQTIHVVLHSIACLVMLSLIVFASLNQSQYFPKDRVHCEYYCTECNHGVHSNTKHCNRCGICVDGFDHHCVWLNVCIGKRNYKLFISTVLSSCMSLAYIITMQSLAFGNEANSEGSKYNKALHLKIKVS